MSIGVQLPFIDYTEVGGDTGQADSDSVLPYDSGEELIEEVLNRPVDTLRLRTERIRGVVDDLLYLRDADRQTLLAGPGQVNWPGAAPGNSGIPTLSANLYLIPFLTPGNSGNTPPIGSMFGSVTLTKVGGAAGITVTSRRRNYEGGNRFNLTVVSGGANAAVLQGTPPRNVLVTAAPSATLGALIPLINALVDEQGTQPLTAALAGGAGSGDIITSPQAQQYIQGNWDAEGHVLTPAAFSSFFATPSNVLQEGDTLAVWYAALTEDPSNPSTLGALGGRRQSIPENSNTTVPAGSLFNTRMHPERLSNALPICKVINGQLILIDGTSIDAGSTGIAVGQTNASDIHYAGGSAWADGTANPATTVEAQLDKVITDLAGTSDGPARLHAIASGVFMTAGTLRAQLNQLDAALSGVVNNGALENWADGTTNPAAPLITQVGKIVHDLGDSAVDGASRIHSLAGGNYMTPGTVAQNLAQLDGVIRTYGFRAAAAVRFTGPSTYSFDFNIGFATGAGSPFRASQGVVNLGLVSALSSVISGVVFVTADFTPGGSGGATTMGALIGGSGGANLVQVSLFNSSGGFADGSFNIIVFGV
jgi:hypothetical protein